MKSIFASDDMENAIIMGDLNIRIGKVQQELNGFDLTNKAVQEVRTSKDKVSNKNGKQFLEFCINFGMVSQHFSITKTS